MKMSGHTFSAWMGVGADVCFAHSATIARLDHRWDHWVLIQTKEVESRCDPFVSVHHSTQGTVVKYLLTQTADIHMDHLAAP